MPVSKSKSCVFFVPLNSCLFLKKDTLLVYLIAPIELLACKFEEQTAVCLFFRPYRIMFALFSQHGFFCTYLVLVFAKRACSPPPLYMKPTLSMVSAGFDMYEVAQWPGKAGIGKPC